MKRPKEKASSSPGVTDNAWARLRGFTAARIGLGRAGNSLPTQHMLAFQLAHAQAQDAVHTPLDFAALIDALAHRPWNTFGEPLRLHSRAVDRTTFLQRPDLGRRLDEASAECLKAYTTKTGDAYDLAIVVADGLSAVAMAQHTVGFLDALIPRLTDANEPWRLAPITLVEQGRVAVGDHVGELLAARCALVLIGERPGLSSPDSMGLYLTWQPRLGRKDAERNCISNIRPAGLPLEEAARRTAHLLNEARRRALSGVLLKDRSDEGASAAPAEQTSFLLDK